MTEQTTPAQEPNPTEALRRELCAAAARAGKRADALIEARLTGKSYEKWAAHRDATHALLYAYCLAGVLKFVAEAHGREVADSLAEWVQSTLENGDFDRINDDVWPKGGDDA